MIGKISPNAVLNVEIFIVSILMDIKLININMAIIKIFLKDIMDLLVIFLTILESFLIQFKFNNILGDKLKLKDLTCNSFKFFYNGSLKLDLRV